MVKRAEKRLGKCEDTDCNYGKSGICAFGLLESHGCAQVIGQDKVKEMADTLVGLKTMEYQAEREGHKDSVIALRKMQDKTFSFVFKGHEYTYKDSARHQGECPHCDNKSPDGGHFWKSTDKAFIGNYTFGGYDCYCFECPECFEKFFYHHKEVTI